MSAIVPSPNAFPFASQEFALVGDTSDARYPAFDISQPDSFIDDALREHINMDAARQQEESEVVEYEGPVPIVDPLSTAMQTYHYVNHTKDKSAHGYLSLYHVKRQIAKPSWSVWTSGTNSSAIPPSNLGLRSKLFSPKTIPMFKTQRWIQLQNTGSCSSTESCKKWLWGASHRSTCKHWGHSSRPLSGSAWMKTTTEIQHTSCTTSLSFASTFIWQMQCRLVAVGFLSQSEFEASKQ